jgi:acyl transferase domain-containing protein
LKRLDDALQDNDNIISVIRGYARNHSADATSIIHPHVQTQERLFRSLLHKTGLSPNDIEYVECHGTGTTAGDSAELESIANVFAKVGSREKPLLVGAIKANLGHSEAVRFDSKMSNKRGLTNSLQAAGILSLIKGAMVLKKEVIAPQVGMPQKLGHYPCLENGQILVPGDQIPFSSPTAGQGRRRILVNNFDAAVRHSSPEC